MSKSHSEPDPRDRVPNNNGQNFQIRKRNNRNYEKTERLIDQIHCDLINGVLKSDVLTKLRQCMYQGQETQKKPFSDTYNYQLIRAAFDRFQDDRVRNEEELLNMFYARYEALYNDALQNGDRMNARLTLSDMGKMLGIGGDKKPNIQISGGNKNITISFGFSNEDKEERDGDTL